MHTKSMVLVSTYLARLCLSSKLMSSLLSAASASSGGWRTSVTYLNHAKPVATRTAFCVQPLHFSRTALHAGSRVPAHLSVSYLARTDDEDEEKCQNGHPDHDARAVAHQQEPHEREHQRYPEDPAHTKSAAINSCSHSLSQRPTISYKRIEKQKIVRGCSSAARRKY